MSYSIFDTNEVFDELYRSWLREWDKWCQDTKKRYGGAAPLSVENQQKHFRVWLAWNKGVILLDSFRDSKEK